MRKNRHAPLLADGAHRLDRRRIFDGAIRRAISLEPALITELVIGVGMRAPREGLHDVLLVDARAFPRDIVHLVEREPVTGELNVFALEYPCLP